MPLSPIGAAGPRPEVTFDNNSDEDLAVVVERADGEYSTSVPAGQENTSVVKECQGIGMRVETEAGEIQGRVDEEVCPNWILTINEDGTLDYTEQP